MMIWKTNCSTPLVCLNWSTEMENKGRTVFCVCGDEAPQVEGPFSSYPNRRALVSRCSPQYCHSSWFPSLLGKKVSNRTIQRHKTNMLSLCYWNDVTVIRSVLKSTCLTGQACDIGTILNLRGKDLITGWIHCSVLHPKLCYFSKIFS